MAACAKVLDTYELLEQILSHLPGRHAFRGQRIAKKWRQISTESVIISKSRCVSPISSLPEEIPPIEDGHQNLSHSQRPACSGYDRFVAEDHWLGIHSHPYAIVPIEDEVLDRIPHYDVAFGVDISNRLGDLSTVGTNKLHGWKGRFLSLPKAPSRPWIKMRHEYLTQPPCTTVTIMAQSLEDNSDECEHHKVHVATGVKVGDVLDKQSAVLKAKESKKWSCRVMFVTSVDQARLRLVHYGPAKW